MKSRLATWSASGLILGLLLLVGCQTKEVTSAKVYMQQKEWDKAIEQLELARETQPANAEVLYLLGQLYGEKKMFAEMREAFDQSLEASDAFKSKIDNLTRKYWGENYNRGAKLYNAKEYSKAIENYEVCLVIDPSRADAYKNLAYAHQGAGEADKTIEWMEKYTAMKSDDVDGLLALGTFYYNAKNYEGAARTYEAVLKLQPDNGRALGNLALSYDLLGQSDKATQIYEDAIAARPDDKDMIFNLARIMYLQERFDKSIDLFARVAELDPEDYEANLNLGNAYLNKAERIRSELKTAEIEGKNMPESELKKKLDEMKGLFGQAIPYLKKAVELKPDVSAVWYNLGVAYVNTGDSDNGTAAFDKAEALK